MLSIIVLSSDGYSDCWEPLFYSFKKYFEGIETYEIILSTNTKKYDYPGLNITSLANGLKSSWSERLKKSLLNSKNEIVLVLAEDFILRSGIDSNMFKGFLTLMKQNDKIDHIRLLTMLNKLTLNSSEFDHLDEIDINSKLRFTYLPGLWKKDVLLRYVKGYESPFISEKFGNIRSKIFKDKFYTVSRNYIESYGQFYDCEPSGILFKGKWPRWVVPFFEKEGIQMDFSKRGIVTKEFRKKAKKNSKLSIMKDPSTIKSVFSLAKLYLKMKK